MINTITKNIIDAFFKKYADNYVSFYIDENNMVVVKSSILIQNKHIEQQPFDIDYVAGDFTWLNNETTSLIGFPKHVAGDFTIADDNITNFYDAPETVDGDYSAYHLHH